MLECKTFFSVEKSLREIEYDMVLGLKKKKKRVQYFSYVPTSLEIRLLLMGKEVPPSPPPAQTILVRVKEHLVVVKESDEKLTLVPYLSAVMQPLCGLLLRNHLAP